MKKLTILFGLALFALMAWQSVDAGGHDCCEKCGHECKPKRVCHVIVEMKKVPKVCYTCECEDFCVPGPSKRCGRAPKPEETPCGELCVQDRWHWNWLPGCASIHTKSKIVKKTTQVEVPTHKWVVEYLCPDCQSKCETEKPAPTPVAEKK